MYLIFVIGTAGSGKSMLTGALKDWLVSKRSSAIAVNLDPGALNLPYVPDVDVRDYVILSDIMEKYKLGPNGALLVAADLIATKIGKIREDVENLNPDYIIIDTPGQMELFAFRVSGPYIAKEISTEPKVVLYLFDAIFSNDPSNFVSNMFLAAAVHLRFLLPQVYVLTKIDLTSAEVVDEILTWSEDQSALLSALENTLKDERRILSRDLIESMASLELTFNLLPVSAKTTEGFLNLHAQLTRIFHGGNELV
jgi:hypothetical protein